MNDTVHPAEEFNNLPWDKIGRDWKDWTISCGGRGFDYNQWAIEILSERKDGTIHAELWLVPDGLAVMFEYFYTQGRERVQKEIKNGLNTKGSLYR